eukprot:COSAG02_NODE_54334_length_296_cov_1.314721_1_plen_22_part_10
MHTAGSAAFLPRIQALVLRTIV